MSCTILAVHRRSCQVGWRPKGDRVQGRGHRAKSRAASSSYRHALLFDKAELGVAVAREVGLEGVREEERERTERHPPAVQAEHAAHQRAPQLEAASVHEPVEAEDHDAQRPADVDEPLADRDGVQEGERQRERDRRLEGREARAEAREAVDGAVRALLAAPLVRFLLGGLGRLCRRCRGWRGVRHCTAEPCWTLLPRNPCT
eukprot:5813241-Prymnesium_polylepis.1